ncbi:hypothetical protein Bca52824_018527 [Brassica carinata]|uniref:Uncharacterized protein n=1 Tax=Brassica carinata TaxID=52824 RepID=A0A8X7VR27_BRACI|nr:hypothetical protein Bca52824_018527 [Brassica carinata]
MQRRQRHWSCDVFYIRLDCSSCVVFLCFSYHAEISVSDNCVKANFVLLGDADPEIPRRQSSDLIDRYFEGNVGMGANHEMRLVDTVSQTHKFRVKISSFNTAKSQTLTVTKVVCPAVLPPIRVVAEIKPDAVYKAANAPVIVHVCNSAIGGTCSGAEPTASSKKSDMQKKAK